MMSNFFKSFGKGLLYVVLFPFILVGIVLYAVFGLFVFIFQLFKLIYLFFTGRTLNSDLEEDIAAKAILEKANNPEKEEVKNDQLSLYPSDSPIYTTDYKSHLMNLKMNQKRNQKKNMRRTLNMIYSPILISLSETDKRIIFAILIVAILVLVLLGYLGYLLVKLMKWQGRKMDTLIHDVVVTKVITNRRHLIRYGRKKNWALFFKQAYIPLIVITFGFIILLIRNSIYSDFNYNPFSVQNGFGTIFWTWKLSNEYVGGDLIKFNIIVLDNQPHFVAEAWAGYISAPCFLIGGLWYLIVVSALMGRTIKLYIRSREVFEKSLDGYNQSGAVNQNIVANNDNNQVG